MNAKDHHCQIVSQAESCCLSKVHKIGFISTCDIGIIPLETFMRGVIMFIKTAFSVSVVFTARHSGAAVFCIL